VEKNELVIHSNEKKPRMARRDDRHNQHQIHYATILPPTTTVNGNGHDESHRKQTELERAKAVRSIFHVK
jgi:hypothetical protein